MSGNVCSDLKLVSDLVQYALGLRPDDVKWIFGPKVVDQCIEEKEKIDIAWFKKQPEPLYQFWRLVIGECFSPKAYVMFTDIGDTPMIRDLSIYSGCKFGNIYLLTYDSETVPIPCPSQKGMLIK